MALQELSIGEQTAELERIVRLNPIVEAILTRMGALPDCCGAAVRCSRPTGSGIPTEGWRFRRDDQIEDYWDGEPGA